MDSAEPTSSPGRPAISYPPNAVHLVRTNQQLTMQLSQMADQKASILMGATFVVFTLAIGEITSNRVTLPLLILAGFSFLATVLSVLALRPKLMKPTAVVSPKSNLVFFGAFAGIPEEEYIDRMIEILRSEEATYRVMARDLYQNGRVLQFKKYRYLSYAYTAFLVGIVATFAAFIIDLLL